jgi:hypothetical protein
VRWEYALLVFDQSTKRSLTKYHGNWGTTKFLKPSKELCMARLLRILIVCCLLVMAASLVANPVLAEPPAGKGWKKDDYKGKKYTHSKRDDYRDHRRDKRHDGKRDDFRDGRRDKRHDGKRNDYRDYRRDKRHDGKRDERRGDWRDRDGRGRR